MKKVAIALLLSLPVCLFAQDYERAAGVRLGVTSGITYKKFTNEQEAIEMIASGRNEGIYFIQIQKTIQN